MTKESNPPDDSFPTSESFVDCCGKPHEFALELLVMASGYFVRATERMSKSDGYAFAAHSETDPYLALGRLRGKIQKGLATRYLAAGEPQPRLGDDVAVGHIAYGGVVVDGRYLTFDELAAILSAHEGWQFKLEVADPYDALL